MNNFDHHMLKEEGNQQRRRMDRCTIPYPVAGVLIIILSLAVLYFWGAS